MRSCDSINVHPVQIENVAGARRCGRRWGWRVVKVLLHDNVRMGGAQNILGESLSPMHARTTVPPLLIGG